MKPKLIAERAESRVRMKISRQGKPGVEKAITENVSSRGVRVISTSEWFVDDTILVAVPAGHFTSAARVAYCDAIGKGRFVTGLEFVGSSKHLELSVLAEAPRSQQV